MINCHPIVTSGPGGLLCDAWDLQYTVYVHRHGVASGEFKESPRQNVLILGKNLPSTLPHS